MNTVLKRSTMADVAKAARVSRATVSLAFSGQRPISTRVKNRVLEEAKRLNFYPHQGAKMLRMGRTKRIAMGCRSLETDFIPIMRMIEEPARRLGYRLFVSGLGETEPEYRDCLLDLVRGQADGVLIADIRIPKELILEMVEEKHHILSPYHIIPGRDDLRAVHLDQKAFGDLFRYLYDMGHRQMAMIWAGKNEALELPEIADRFFREKGLPLGPDREITQCASIEEAKVITRDLLLRCPEITALICTSDLIAFGAIGAAYELGLRIPDDLTITGGTNSPFGLVSTPTLTTLRRPYQEMCAAWVKNLIDRIEGKPAPPLITMPMELIVRGSSGPPRARKNLFDRPEPGK